MDLLQVFPLIFCLRLGGSLSMLRGSIRLSVAIQDRQNRKFPYEG